MPDTHDLRALVPGSADDFVADFQHRIRDASCDVGLLEIDARTAKSLGANFVADEEILAEFAHDKSPVIVAGYPGQLIHSTDKLVLADAVALVHDFRSLALFTETFEVSEWPTDLERPPDASTDLFASFDPNLQLQLVRTKEPATPSENFDVDALRLHGISGGGIWLDSSSSSDSTVWHPCLRLIALDVSCHSKQKWLRGTLIGRWLDLAHAHYADLRSAIRAIRKLR